MHLWRLNPPHYARGTSALAIRASPILGRSDSTTTKLTLVKSYLNPVPSIDFNDILAEPLQHKIGVVYQRTRFTKGLPQTPLSAP